MKVTKKRLFKIKTSNNQSHKKIIDALKSNKQRNQRKKHTAKKNKNTDLKRKSIKNFKIQLGGNLPVTKITTPEEYIRAGKYIIERIESNISTQPKTRSGNKSLYLIEPVRFFLRYLVGSLSNPDIMSPNILTKDTKSYTWKTSKGKELTGSPKEVFDELIRLLGTEINMKNVKITTSDEKTITTNVTTTYGEVIYNYLIDLLIKAEKKSWNFSSIDKGVSDYLKTLTEEDKVKVEELLKNTIESTNRKENQEKIFNETYEPSKVITNPDEDFNDKALDAPVENIDNVKLDLKITETEADIKEKAQTGTDEPESETDKPEAETDEPITGTDESEAGAVGADKPETGTETETDESEAGAVGADKPATGTDEPITGTDEPITGTDEPITGTDEPITGTDEPITGTDEPITGTDEPITGTDEPITGTDEPEAGTDEPEAGTDEPEAGTDEPETGTDEPEAGTETGVAGAEEETKADETDAELAQLESQITTPSQLQDIGLIESTQLSSHSFEGVVASGIATKDEKEKKCPICPKCNENIENQTRKVIITLELPNNVTSNIESEPGVSSTTEQIHTIKAISRDNPTPVKKPEQAIEGENEEEENEEETKE
jgi:hypothetical protein